MGILSALFLGLTALGISAHSENKSRNRINSYLEARIADGFEREQNKELEKQYFQELIQLWRRSLEENNPDLFYPEKHTFFRASPEFAWDWAQSEAEEHIIRDGYAPSTALMPFSMARSSNHAWYRYNGGFEEVRRYAEYLQTLVGSSTQN